MSKAQKLKRKFLKAGTGSYTFETILDDDQGPLTVGIRKIDLLELGILKQIPFDGVAPKELAAMTSKKGGKAAEDARALALDIAEKVESIAMDFLTSDEQKGIALSIQIIDAGCPDLRGAIKASEDDCEWEFDEEGNRGERLDLLWTDMGKDFPELIRAILKLSNIWEERVNSARSFR